MNKVKFIKLRKSPKGYIPLVITFYPLLKDVGNIIHKNLYLLYMNQETQRVFTPPAVEFNCKILWRLNILHHIGLWQGCVHYFWLQLEFCIPPLFDGVFYKIFFLSGIMINFSEFDHCTKNSTTAITNYQFVNIALFIKNVELKP